MYAGAGAGPMLAAAAAWDVLATDLYTTASCYGSAISEISGLWTGPASISMATAAAPYVAWLSATAARAEQAAVQAKAAAIAYEAAFAMTVPPPVIAANRAQLMMLIATNFFGQNFPAIAATEAHYAEMWAQDAVAMYGYAGASAAASMLPTFDQPPPTTNPMGHAGQATAVAHAAETAAGTSAQPLQSVPATLQALALPTSSSSSPTSGLLSLRPFMSGLLGESQGSPGWSSSPLGKLLTAKHYSDLLGMGYSGLGSWDHMIKVWEDVLPAAAATKGAEAAASLPGLSGALGGGAPLSAGVSAGIGQAGTVGNLSVPQSWAAAAPATSAASAASPVSSISGGTGARPEGMLRGIPLFPGTGRQSGGDIGQRYGFRHSVMARPLPAG